MRCKDTRMDRCSPTTPSGRLLSAALCAPAHAGARRDSFAVVGAVGCSVSSQYGVKFLVDTLSVGPGGDAVWIAFGLLVSLIAADNLLWRSAGWIASHAFVGVTGDLRSELFRHLTGHAPSYFSPAPGGNVDRPHHRDIQRRLRGRKSVHLECPAALRGDDWRHRLPRRRQHPDGGGADRDRGARHADAVRLAAVARRSITASPTGPHGSKANWPT